MGLRTRVPAGVPIGVETRGHSRALTNTFARRDPVKARQTPRKRRRNYLRALERVFAELAGALA